MSINNLDTIYQELGENICLYPFYGAFYQTNNVVPNTVDAMPNSVRPCSIVMADDRHKWDIKNNSVHQARNSPEWVQMRQDFVNNKFHEIHDCRSCSYNEKSGVTSPRQQNNKFLAQFIKTDIVAEVKEIIANDYQVRDIVTLDYYPSNYCNYACVMCAGGASSKRQTYEINVLKRQEHIVLNPADPDFFDILNRVEVINFTGGETVLQKQVHDVMDYLIQQDLAKNVLITLLTNASSSPDDLADKFEHFKHVIYNVSIDGIGAVSEYQRRGSKWARVEPNALRLMHHPDISTVINFVLTGVNALNIMDFVNWAYANNFGPERPDQAANSYINVSPVFRVDHIGVAALPPELRNITLSRLEAGRKNFSADTPYDNYYRELVDRFISVVQSTPHNPEYLPQFVDYMRLEDSQSKLKLAQVVPEWAPYFQG